MLTRITETLFQIKNFNKNRNILINFYFQFIIHISNMSISNVKKHLYFDFHNNLIMNTIVYLIFFDVSVNIVTNQIK